uniref:Putative secreted protein n=1 Tax=Anopheles darlingi TaxID=43151 RepID=A0A2M4D6P0_ANODA
MKCKRLPKWSPWRRIAMLLRFLSFTSGSFTGCGRFAFILEVQEDEREQEHSDHHREGADVVREGARDEPLVLGVGKGTHRYLGGRVELCVTDAIIVHLKLVNTVHIRNAEASLIPSTTDRFERGAYERIDPHELELHIGRFERFPLAIGRQGFDFDRVNHRIGDRVRRWWLSFTFLLVGDGAHPDHTVLSKHPATDCRGNILVTRALEPFAGTSGLHALDSGQEGFVGEEVERTGEHNPGVVTRLEGRNQ